AGGRPLLEGSKRQRRPRRLEVAARGWRAANGAANPNLLELLLHKFGAAGRHALDRRARFRTSEKKTRAGLVGSLRRGRKGPDRRFGKRLKMGAAFAHVGRGRANRGESQFQRRRRRSSFRRAAACPGRSAEVDVRERTRGEPSIRDSDLERVG